MHLRTQYDGPPLKVEGEMAGEVEAARQPSPLRHVELRTSAAGVGLEVIDGAAEGAGVESRTVSHAAEVGD